MKDFVNYLDLLEKKIGILGGGQLGKMLAIAAHNLGIKVVIFSNTKNSPASYVTNNTIIAEYNDKDALAMFRKSVTVITSEFENIPAFTLDFLIAKEVMHPNADILKITQDRFKEKQFVNSLGIRTAVFEKFINIPDANLDYPFIVKTRNGGYDGKGQHLIRSIKDTVDLKIPSIAEEVVGFQKEISILIARDFFGNIEFFPIIENVHINGLLYSSSVPANISNRIIKKAQAIGTVLVEKMNYVGVMTIELFLIENEELLVNEIAPRVHNSGHLTVEACNVSQFEQHVRAICGLPLKQVRLYFPCKMYNIIGDEIMGIKGDLESPEKKVTIYGKMEIKDGRKMGHFTIPQQ